jgi:hypothetical protein
MSIERDLTRGARAKQLLEDPLLTEAFESVEKALHDKWANAPISDRDGQHELLLMLKLMRDVRANLEHALADGNFAADKLKHLNRHLTPAEFSAANYR